MTTLLQSKPKIEHIANGKCVCQACNCGKHKCPSPLKKGTYESSYHTDYPKYEGYVPEGKYKMIQKNFILPEDKFTGQSAYLNDFGQKVSARPAEKFVPKSEITLSKQPFDGSTSYVNDYLNKGQGSRAEKVQLPKNYVFPQGKFDGDTNYNQDFVGSSPEKQKQFKPVGELKVGGDFQGVSSYGTDYENKGVGARAERIPLPKNQVMPEGRFQGNSNYAANYVPSKAERAQKFVPEGQLKIGGNFQGTSSYGNDYLVRQPGQRTERYPLPQNQVMPEGRFEGSSNYTDNYIKTRAERSPMIKPEGEIKLGGDFNGQSSYLAEYSNKGMGVKAEKIPLPKNQILPEGRFEGDSNYQAHYLGAKVERQPQFRPEGELKIGGNFHGVSSYGADFQYKGVGAKAERYPLPKNQVMPQGRFQGNTAYNADFVESKAQRNVQYRPVGQIQIGDGRFQGQSSYSNDYLNQGKPVRAERVPLPRNQVMPEGKFQSSSTYTDNYIPTAIERNPQYRPTEQLKVGGKFEGNSTYGQAYTGAYDLRKQNCPCDDLQAPRHQVAEKEHIRYNQQTKKWQ